MINTALAAGRRRAAALGRRATIALLLFNDPLYVFAFEVVGVLLTAAVIGGVFLAKQEDAPDPGERRAVDPRAPPLADRPPRRQPARAIGAAAQRGEKP